MKYAIKIFIIIGLFITVQACSDVLNNTEPSQSVNVHKALNTLSGVKAIRAEMYSIMSSFNWTTEYMLAPAMLADNLALRPTTNRFSGKAINTEANTAGTWTDTDGYDDSAYEIINQANIILKAINKKVVPDELLTQFRGEAYFFRAFAMHQLARVYGYDPGAIPQVGQGAGFNLSIVIRTKPILTEEDATFKGRSTIKETYDQIISDLKKQLTCWGKVRARAPIL